jgi:bla regulator protein blaR1
MNNLFHLFSNELVAVLGWSLLHSLWQGTLIALLLGIGLLFSKKYTSNFRYNLAASSLGLTLAAFLGTFAYLYNAAQAQKKAFNATMYIVAQENYNQLVNQVTESQSLFSIFLAYFNEHLPVIVVFWMLGVLVLSLRFLGALVYLQRLRHAQNQNIENHWQERLYAIKAKIGVQKSVELMESALIKVPMVIGYLKPIVLLPIGTVNALSAAEVEAILAHELAHIKRNDYLVNLIQSVIDVLFFYHPAVWWMSNTVRTERENCCDDLALSVTGNSLIIAKALANLESLRQRSYNLSLAFTGNKNQLFNRISRLLGQPMKKNNHFVEGLVAVVVILLCLTTINYRVNASTAQAEKAEMVNDSIVPKQNGSLNAGEKVIEEYIIIEQEITETPTTPNSSFFMEWTAANDFPLLETTNALHPFFPKELPLVERKTIKWIKSNDDKLLLNEFPNDSKGFLMSPLDFELEVSLADGFTGFGKMPTWEEKSIKITPSIKRKAFFIGSNLENEPSNEGYSYQWAGSTSTAKVESVEAMPDTSILDDAEVIIIDGDNITVIRKKSKLKEVAIEREMEAVRSDMQRIERLRKIENATIEREMELAKRQVERELAANEKRLEAEKAHIRTQMQRMEEQRIRVEAQAKKIQEEQVRKMQIRVKERAEKQEMRNEELEKQLIKDGYLKIDEKLKTLDINQNNGKVSMKVNGKKIPEHKAKEYIKIIEKHN